MEENNKISIYNWWHESVPISELKKWLDEQIKEGKNYVRMDLSWGYYNDISDVKLVAQ